MKKIFKLTLDTEFTINFSSWGLSDAQQGGGAEAKKLLISHYLNHFGLDEFELSEKNSGSLFEAIADVVRVQNECALTLVR